MKRDLSSTFLIVVRELNRKVRRATLPLLLAVALSCFPVIAQVGNKGEPVSPVAGPRSSSSRKVIPSSKQTPPLSFQATGSEAGIPQSETTLMQTPLLVWKVGSPFSDDTPDNVLPPALQLAARQAGARLIVETFPAQGFAQKFFDAVARQAEPDILAIVNYGIIDGITTPLGNFVGIGSSADVRQSLRSVDESFEALRGRRGWQFLITTSRNHNAAKALALSAPECASETRNDELSLPAHEIAALKETVVTACKAYLSCDLPSLGLISDPARLSTGCRFGSQESHVLETKVCSIIGNQHLAFVKALNSFEVKGGQLGRKTLMAVLRKEAANWQLLTITDDPLIEDLEHALTTMSRSLTDEAEAEAPQPATQLNRGSAAREQRFGEFTWRPGKAPGVICEVAEFEYEKATRLFISFPPGNSMGRISEGLLWTTRGPWHWRIWSIARDGRLAISEVQSFVH